VRKEWVHFIRVVVVLRIYRTAPPADRSDTKTVGTGSGSFSAAMTASLVGFASRPVQLDLNFAINDPHRVAADLDARAVGPGAVGEAETPGVPGTGYDSFFDEALAQGTSHVRADIVDGVVPALVAEDGDELAVHCDRSTFPLLDIFDPANRLKLGHRLPFDLDYKIAACHDFINLGLPRIESGPKTGS
jgi:hypothetical protein